MWYMDAKGVAVFAHGFPYDMVMLFQDVSSLNILNWCAWHYGRTVIVPHSFQILPHYISRTNATSTVLYFASTITIHYHPLLITQFHNRGDAFQQTGHLRLEVFSLQSQINSLKVHSSQLWHSTSEVQAEKSWRNATEGEPLSTS